MGQRTNLLLSMENKAGARLNKVYHLQWGYGKVMPVMLLNILSGQHIGIGKEKQDFFTSVIPKTDDLFELQRDYSCFDFTRLEDCKKVCRTHFNGKEELIPYFDTWQYDYSSEGKLKYKKVKRPLDKFRIEPWAAWSINEECIVEDNIENYNRKE